MTTKVLSVVLLLAIALTAFAGCGENSSTTSLEYAIGLESDPINSYDNVSVYEPENESKTTSEESEDSSKEIQGEEPHANGFVVMDKKYTHKDTNVVIINVENQTDKNYAITITGTYLDKDGNVLTTETQTSDQYSSKYQGYFLFAPGITFDKFTYKLETKETNGPFYAKDIIYAFKGLSEWKVVNHELLAQGDRTKYPHICAAINIAYKGTVQLFVRSTFVFVNENGQIVGFGNVNEPILSNPNPVFEGESHLPLYNTKEEKMTWPDEFKGKITAILIINSVEISE